MPLAIRPLLPSLALALCILLAPQATHSETSDRAAATDEAAAASESSSYRLDDFEDGDTEGLNGTPWNAHDDTYLDGGASTSAVSVVERGTEESSKALRIEGEVNDGFSAPFAGANLLLDAEGTGHDLSAYESLRFMVRGDGGTYLAQILIVQVQDFNEFSTSFRAPAEWTRVEIPFTQLKQSPYWGRQVEWSAEGIRGFAVQTASDTRGSFHLEIDDIEFVTASDAP
ncbi:MAG: CIA30 family protein [Acidobacteriota bacterium]